MSRLTRYDNVPTTTTITSQQMRVRACVRACGFYEENGCRINKNPTVEG